MIKHSLKAIFALTFLSFCTSQEKTTEDTSKRSADEIFMTDEQLKNLSISITNPKKKAIASFLSFNGKVKPLPNLQATVTTDIEGKIENIFVKEGQYVKKGSPLISLRSMALIELQNEYLASRSEADFLKIEFERQAELRKSDVGSLADFQNTESKYKASIGKEKAIRAKLELLGLDSKLLADSREVEISKTLIIRAPIDGYILILPVSIGMLAATQTTLAQIVNPSDLMAHVYVYDKDIDMIKESQEVDIDFINASFPVAKGRVVNIERGIDENTKAITVHVQFKSPPKCLVLPDMNVKATIFSKDDEDLTFTVPNSALLKEDDSHFVYEVLDKRDTKKRSILRKMKVNIQDKNDEVAEVIFKNEFMENSKIAENNVMVLEAERMRLNEIGVE